LNEIVSIVRDCLYQLIRIVAFSRYEAIVKPEESREIDYESVDPGVTKPTKAAIRVNDLLESITDRYRPLQSFSQKLRFLIDIQITIFDNYHEALSYSLDAYIALNSSIARTVQGISKEEQAKVEGLAGLERLCRVYGSAEYLEKRMRDWSDDVFFLELWDELQYRARNKTKTDSKFAGDMSVADVAGRTSSTVGSDIDNGALFDETAGAYHRLRVRAEGIMQENLAYDVRESLRPYGRITSWASISTETQNPASLSISSELDNTIQKLTSYLSFLSKALAEAPLRRISRQLALAVQSFIWDNVLLRNNFSTAGVAQFKRDVEGIWSVFDKYSGPGQGKLGMRKLADALTLVGLPIRGKEATGENQSNPGKQFGIWEVEKKIFKNNESARDMLEEMGLENLTEIEARTVLEKRVELAS
jgi:RAD50-interacting protein 1